VKTLVNEYVQPLAKLNVSPDDADPIALISAPVEHGTDVVVANADEQNTDTKPATTSTIPALRTPPPIVDGPTSGRSRCADSQPAPFLPIPAA
jgi:hypothetical protein